MRVTAIVVACAIAVCAARTADAHPLEMGYLRVDAHGHSVAVSLELDVGAAATLLGVDASTLDAAAVPARATALATAAYRAVPLADGCAWTAATAELHRRTIAVSDLAVCAGEPSALHWSLPFVSRVSPTFQLLATAHGFGGGDASRVVVVDRVTPTLDVEAGAPAVSLGAFVVKGIEHIGVAPSEWHDRDGRLHLPDGIDHILFLLGLLLGGGRLLRLAGIASGFTIGHTLTLGLATFGILRPPASVIEPLIALTIAVVAVEAYTGKLERHRWKLATGFGLIHGFGFAAAMTKLDLSRGDMVRALFGYNFGVEIGQLVIIAVIAPLVILGYRHPRFQPVVVRALAAAIFVAALYWFFLRLFG
jgi:hypothetical protein